MRILMVTPAYYPFVEKGGPAVKARALAEHLVRRGHIVTVLTVEYGSSAARTETIAGVEVIYLRPRAAYRATTLNAGVTAFCRERLRRFDLVHFFGLYDLLGPQVGRFCRKWSIPYVVEPLGMLRPRDRSLMLKRVWQTLLGRRWLAGAARIIVTSRAERAEALGFGYPEEKVKLRYNGLSLDEFARAPAGAFRARLGIAPEEPLVLFLGRLIPRKGADLLIDAFAEAFPTKGRLVIAGPEGEPGYLKQLKARAQERSLTDRVLFPGALQGEEKVAALADADVFALPSRYENFANAAAEAIACGTPVIITDRCGISELVDSRAGIVIPCEASALVAALKCFFDTPELRGRLEAGCLQLAERLDWSGLVIQQGEIYREAVEHRSSERRAERFYDAHPFDWVDAESLEAIRASIAPALQRLIEEAPRDSLILDVGCGPGRVTQFLALRGLRCVGLDASARSVRIMSDRCGCPGAVADNRALPVKDAAADLVISDGVLHHTGNSFGSFEENCRVLGAGGRMYVAVYKPGGRYQKLYRSPGGLIRAAVRNAALRPVVHATLLPLYFAVHLVKPRGTRTWRGARNLFYDYFVSPHVEFISREIVEDWCHRCGMTLCEYDSNPAGNTHSFVLEKQRVSGTRSDRITRWRAPGRGKPAMKTHRKFALCWGFVNVVAAVSLVMLLYGLGWEYSMRRYLAGFSDAVVPLTAAPEEKVEAILAWMDRGPERRKLAEPYDSSRNPKETLNYQELLAVCGTATNAFVNLAASSGLEARRVLLLDENHLAKHVSAEVRLDGWWVVVDPLFRTVLRDAAGRPVSKEQLRDPETFREVTSRIPGYPPTYGFERTAHVRLSRIPVIGRPLRRTLDSIVPGWDSASFWSLLLERESLAFTLASALLLFFSLAARHALSFYGERKLGFVRPHFRDRLAGACSALFRGPA